MLNNLCTEEGEKQNMILHTNFLAVIFTKRQIMLLFFSSSTGRRRPKLNFILLHFDEGLVKLPSSLTWSPLVSDHHLSYTPDMTHSFQFCTLLKFVILCWIPLIFGGISYSAGFLHSL